MQHASVSKAFKLNKLDLRKAQYFSTLIIIHLKLKVTDIKCKQIDIKMYLQNYNNTHNYAICVKTTILYIKLAIYVKQQQYNTICI